MAGKNFPASHRHARMSPYKVRPVIDLVRGKGVNHALSILEYQDQRAAPMIRRVIQSALANASNDMDVKLNNLIVSEARVDGGPLLRGGKRFMPRAMGRAFPIRKRTCHIVVTLTEGPPQESKATAKGKSPGKARARREALAAAKSAGAGRSPAGKKE